MCLRIFSEPANRRKTASLDSSPLSVANCLIHVLNKNVHVVTVETRIVRCGEDCCWISMTNASFLQLDMGECKNLYKNVFFFK